MAEPDDALTLLRALDGFLPQPPPVRQLRQAIDDRPGGRIVL